MKSKISQLVSMMGKEWMYNTKLYQFIEVEGESYPISLITDKRVFKFEVDAEVKYFIEACLPVDSEPEKAVSVPDPLTGDLFVSLSGVLLDNIKKVKEDPAYMKQATVISKQVQTIINLTNLQLNVSKQK